MSAALLVFCSANWLCRRRTRCTLIPLSLSKGGTPTILFVRDAPPLHDQTTSLDGGLSSRQQTSAAHRAIRHSSTAAIG
jgi:hypothetical protein